MFWQDIVFWRIKKFLYREVGICGFQVLFNAVELADADEKGETKRFYSIFNSLAFFLQ